jgi:hypothetical protein
VSYDRDIRPLLSNVCFRCHGPDEATRKRDLRLDLKEGLFSTTEMGLGIVVPGKPGESELVFRISHEDPDEKMPPGNSLHTLSPRNIETITRWVEQGAEYTPHWSYTPLGRPTPPDVKESKWVRNPIDRFVLQQLEARGLQPSPEADAVTLARRLSIDITGLPPTPEEVQNFGRDGYAATLDRLLASPHYGERMAVNWLDLVRYADSNGYHADRLRSVWPYRDYVINAFNTNKPFDEFTIEQLAGDLIENETTENLVASGYNRLNQITEEGGSQAKEYLAIYSGDRVRTTASVWLGATLGCAQCHDHKFDPFTMKDFYSFAAFFSDIDEVGVYSDRGRWEPFLAMPTAEEQAEELELRAELADLAARLEVSDEELAEERDAWIERTRMNSALMKGDGWAPVQPGVAQSNDGLALEVLPDFSVLSAEDVPDRDTYEVSFTTKRNNITGIRLEVLSHDTFEGSLTRGNEILAVTEFELFLHDNESEELTNLEIASAVANDELEEHIASRAIDGNSDTAWLVAAEEDNQKKAVLALALAEPLEGGPNTTLTVRIHQDFEDDGAVIGRFRLSLTTVDDVRPHEEVGIPLAIRLILNQDGESRAASDVTMLNAYYRALSPTLAAMREEIADREHDLEEHIEEYTTTLVTEAVAPRTIRILPRGNWMDDSGEVVSPAVPEFLGASGSGGDRATRMDLAQWLVNRDNPLTARVFVNRLWNGYFGTGLSKVLDDLGAQGEAPTHPELLDWLAVEFVDSGWDVKHMVRLMTSSATYRQSSASFMEICELDPYNRLVARQSRIRYSAETIRDTALALSGLLVRDIGGRSVRPYQPAGYYAHMNFPKREYEADSGEHLYRRGLYTHWQRTYLHPSMLAFDAPSREECTAERPRSNTPQQALVLLNDPIFAEAARVFAERVLHEGGDDVENRIEWAMNQALCRMPVDDERALLQALYARHLAEFRRDPDAAQAALNVGEWAVPRDIDIAELAAWTSVARVIMNLAEVITRA